ncbi:hypothetical protein IB284_26050 [Ralstonia insidiosa]|nr:hypothetical protein [Ralstonia insidiosa]
MTVTSQEAIVFRLECDGVGPFWCERTMRRLIRQCRKLTPEWKRADDAQQCSSFLEHYAAHAQFPYDVPEMDFFLSRANPSPHWRFAFSYKAALLQEFGVTSSALYLAQFQKLLDTEPSVTVRVYLAHVLAQTPTEVLFDNQRSEMLEEAGSWDTFLRL